MFLTDATKLVGHVIGKTAKRTIPHSVFIPVTSQVFQVPTLILR